jgi:hypothetical protein
VSLTLAPPALSGVLFVLLRALYSMTYSICHIQGPRFSTEGRPVLLGALGSGKGAF